MQDAFDIPEPVSDDEADAPDGPVPTPGFDPRSLGCACDACDLGQPGRTSVPVPPELRPGAVLTVIAEAPGKWEELNGRPLDAVDGPSGKELDKTVRACGFSRFDLSLDNVQLCRVPGKNIDQYRRRLSKRNAKRELDGLEPLLEPTVACRPHVEQTVAASRALLVLGKTAFGVLTGSRTGEENLSSVRGFPLEVRGLPALATWHPAHILRNRRWTEIFRSDIAKAFRHATGKLQWVPPEVIFNPTLAQLDAALDRLSREQFVACDTETEPAPGKEFDPETDNLRCVALGTASFGVVCGFRSVPAQKQPTLWNTPPSLAAERIARFFASCDGQTVDGVRRPLLVGHNFNVYDRPILARHGMPLPDFPLVLDTLPMSRNAWSELRHNLDFLMSRYTDAPKHKGRAETGAKVDHDAWESDYELGYYCCMDVAATWTILPSLLREVRKTNQGRVYRSDVRMQQFAVGAHRAGMLIDPAERRRHDDRLTEKMRLSELAAHAAVDESGRWHRREPINLASVPQVREYLYDCLGLPWQLDDEDDDDPTTKRDAMYELLQVAGLPPHARRFVDALLDYRSAFRARQKDVRGLRVGPDGRVHPTWSAMGVTGRPQSGDPNVSNIPDRKRDMDSLRSMYVAAPGCVLVGCDLEQVELRTVAALSGDELWLELFRRQEQGEKIDLHKINASVYFDGKPPSEIEPFERDYAKCVVGSTRVPVVGRGLLRIQDLGMAPAGADVPLADTSVLGPDGSPVRAGAFYAGGRQKTYRVRTRSGFVVEGTGKHRLLTADGRLLRLDHARVGDALRLPPVKADVFAPGYVSARINPWVAKNGPYAKSSRVFRHEAPGLPVLALDERWGYILGALQGDGSVTTAGVSMIGLVKDGVVRRVATLLAEVGLIAKVVTGRRRLRQDGRTGRALHNFQCNSTPFKEFLARIGFCGRRGKHLEVPDFVFRSPRSVVVQYLAGLFDTDGTVGTDGVSMCSKSEDLIRGVKLLLHALGMHSRIGRSWNKTYKKMYYLLYVPRRETRQFAAIIPLACRRKRALLAEKLAVWGPGRAAPTADEIVEISCGQAEVFDLCVPSGHLFVANGLVNHNTLTYMYLYSGGARRAMINMRQVLNPKTGGRPYATMTLKRAREARDKLLRAHPTLARWWDRTVEEWRRDRFLREPILGRIRYFLDGEGSERGEGEEQRAELINFRAQSSVAGWMSGSGAVGTVMDEIGWPWSGRLHGLGGAGLIQHGYDSMIVEVAEAEAARAGDILEAAMTTRWTINDNEIKIPAKRKMGRRWSDLA